MADPWQREQGEPNKWFQRFRIYMDMGPNRSLLGAYKHDKARNGATGKPTNVPPVWRTMSDQWRWQDRAEAYDLQQLRQREDEAAAIEDERRQADAQLRIEWRAKRQAMAQLAFNRVAASLNKLTDPEDLPNLNRAVQAVKVVLGELRAEFDELPTQRTRTVTIDPAQLAEMSDEELEEYERALKRNERFNFG
jgi:hypothetical protein